MEQKRLIIALILSVVVIAIYQRYFYKPAYYAPSSAQTTQHNLESLQDITARMMPQQNDEDASTSIVANETDYILENDNLIITCSNINGCIKKIQLKKYNEADTNQPLLLTENNKNWPGLMSLIQTDNATMFDARPNLYNCVISKNKIVFNSSFDGIYVEKEYSVNEKNSDVINISIKLNNPANKPIDFNKLGVVLTNRIDQTGVMTPRYSRLTILTSVKKHVYNLIFKKTKDIIEQTYWIGLSNKYFTFLVKPNDISQQAMLQQVSINREKDNYPVVVATDFLKPTYNQTEYVMKFKAYAGPTKPNIIAQALDIKEYEVADSGFLKIINDSISAILATCYKITKNWGVAIIILSLLINLMFFPLTKQSLVAMKKIQALQPELELLKERNKSNPQKLNKEMIEFWQKNKVNPFSGCLPLVVQLPIFFALYNVFMKNIELRNASFLWMKDLASPDIVSVPFISGVSIHLLPILMAIIMFIQQKIAQPATATSNPSQFNQQKFLAIFFPIFLGFVLYGFPSGLVLYWATSTLFNLLEQVYITRRVKI